MSASQSPPPHRWGLPWRKGRQAQTTAGLAPTPSEAVTDFLWSVNDKGLLTSLTSPAGLTLPQPWWRVLRLAPSERRKLMTCLRAGRSFRGVRAQFRSGGLAGRPVDVTGQRHKGGWSGAAVVLDDPWTDEIGLEAKRGAELVRAVLDQAVIALSADHLFVARVERDGTLVPEYTAMDPSGKSDLPSQPYRSAGTACGDVLAARRPLVITERFEDRYPLFGRFRRLGITAYAGVPLFDGPGAPSAILVALKAGRFGNAARTEALLSAAAERIAPHFHTALTERALARSVERMTSLLDHLPGMAYRIRMSGDGRRRVLYVSRGATRLIGVSPAELCRWPAERLLELRHPDDRERSLSETLEQLTQGVEVNIRWRLVRPDGKTLWVLAREKLVERDGADFIVEGILLDFAAEAEIWEKLEYQAYEPKAVANSTPDWMTWLDDDGTPRWINPGVEQVTGYTAEECRTLTDYPRDLIHEEDMTVFDNAMAAAKGGTTAQDIDIRIRRRWGNPAWCSLSVQPMVVEGLPPGIRLCIRRIDRRKAAEQMLHQREEEIARVLAALDLVREAVVVSDSGGLVTYANDAAARLLGFESAAALRGRPWRELGLTDSAAAPFLDIIESSLASRGTWRGEIALGHGENIKFLDTHFARLPEGGFIAVLTDIGARKRTDEQLRENQERYQALFETAGDAIFLMEGANIIDCNPRAETILGYDRNALRQQGLHDFAPRLQPDGRDSQAVAAKLLSKALTGQPQAYEWLGRHRDGTPVYLDVSLTSVPRRGRPYLVAVARDITERRRREEEQRRLEQQLQQARKLDALGQLAGGVAHDFNNILGAIRGFADLLVDEVPVGSHGERYVRRILTASDRAKGVVRQILTFTRRTEVARRSLDLTRLAEECAGLLQASIPSTTGIALDLGDKAVMVDGDRDQLSQVILNLVINANDALGGAPGAIRIDLAPTRDDPALRQLTGRTLPDLALVVELMTDPEGGVIAVTGSFDPERSHTTLSIIDDGPGIPEAVIERAFDPFFTTKAAGHGTGLGLAVVHSIVLAHHGAIILRSRPGKGCRFDIVLPTGGEAHPEVEATGDIPVGLPPKTRVLVVDDDVDFGDMILAVLEHHGAEAAVVSSPVEALEVLRQHPDAWDVIVTDQTMPDMRGIDLVRAVKAIRPNLPCLICTGNPESLNDGILASAGVFALIQKPVDFPHLFALLGRALAAE